MNDTMAADGSSRIQHVDAAAVATSVYERMLALLEQLDADDWSRPTDCAAWDVADIVGHLIGAAKGHASLREMARQFRYGKGHAESFDGNEMDAMNDLQVRDHAGLSPQQRVEALRAIAPAAVRKRTTLPRLLGRIPVPIAAGVGSLPEGLAPSVPLRHLNDVILTRDVLMHRIDVARATDRDPMLDDEVDRLVVADAVAEWADNHGRPFVLRLDGPAGGSFRRGSGGPTVSSDVVEFCRAVTGRCEADGLLATPVLF